ncbi:MAG TPA: electron transport complex subunit E [Bacteroidales bacterium]|nr:electron transport complex subunit E [Bacteroidales bacterium]HOH22688.1 electron transport complex subunit E [Bacteroidales bacterium]HPB57911.1 electron transport complex subunit E [Bacteroidales bacterium]HPZ04354.1 electron transport complex subunit E [Bacteroidales bacterium]HQB75943.1 electron transport complex subunit E [Bacteroidales bacterium]
MSKLSIVTKGFIKENPVLVLVLGTCPTLAVTTSVENGIGMGLATTFVLVLSNMFISLLRKITPNEVRIPIFIVVIATFVSIVDLLIQGFVPALAESLGLFIPLIVVNCIVLGRAEAFASKNGVFDSMLDGLGMGIGFTIALVIIGTVREILGSGAILGYEIPFMKGNEILIFVLAPGAFFVFGYVMALVRFLQKK